MNHFKSNAYDNNNKKISRELIAKIINDHFKDKKISMLELLGSGVGTNFYINKLNNLSKLSLIERSRANVKWFKAANLPRINRSYPKLDIEIFNKSLDKFLINECIDNKKFKINKTFDVLNFDFCGIFYPEAKTLNNVSPIILSLIYQLINDNGIIFTTHQIDGWIPIKHNIEGFINDPDEISNFIKKINNFYTIEEIHRHTYKSQEENKKGKASTMLNLGFKIKKK